MSSPFTTPLPRPPRTPTPPPDHDAPQPPSQTVGLGFEGELSAGELGFDPNALSPLSASFSHKPYANATLAAPGDSVSQTATPLTAYTTAPSTISALEAPNPFNFQSVAYQPGQPAAKQNVGSAMAVAHTG